MIPFERYHPPVVTPKAPALPATSKGNAPVDGADHDRGQGHEAQHHQRFRGWRMLPFLVLLLVQPIWAAATPTNFFHEQASLLDVTDPVADDRGPGFYTYPLDKRLRRGTFDIKRFSVYEEGKVVTFVIQMREYIMTEFPGSRRSAEQGFVANLFDIYLDTDRRPGSGYHKALPGRDLEFEGEMGWEKMIMVTPLSQFSAYDIIKHKTDELGFQNMVPDIILPDYVAIQRDKIIIQVSKEFLGKPNDQWGFQLFAMGFSNVVSPNRLLNKDVKAFATMNDFGGGWDTYGDPPIMDCLMPEGIDQYETLRQYRSQPYRDEITYAKVPFLYAAPLKKARRFEAPEAVPTATGRAQGSAPAGEVDWNRAPALALPPEPTPVAPSVKPAVTQARKAPKAPAKSGKTSPVAAPTVLMTTDAPGPVSLKPRKTSEESTDGFLPLPKHSTSTTGFQPLGKPAAKTAPGGFVPLKKKTGP